MASINKWMPLVLTFGLLLLNVDLTEGRKSGGKRNNKEDNSNDGGDEPNNIDNRFPLGPNLDSERSKFQIDTETSAQALNSAIQNPLLYQNQAGGLANLGGGIFSNQAQLGQFGGQFGSGQLGQFGQFGGGGINPYLQGGLGGGGYQNGLGVGGYQGLGQFGGGGYQNPYLGGGNYLGGYGGLGGVAPDIYTQGALSAQLYNNPLYGAGAGTLTGAAAGINPLLLRGVQNSQYPIVGGLGNYGNPYLAAQALLSPYSNYNQLGNYPFSSRFGIGAGTGRSGLGGNRFTSQNSNNRNNDE